MITCQRFLMLPPPPPLIAILFLSNWQMWSLVMHFVLTSQQRRKTKIAVGMGNKTQALPSQLLSKHVACRIRLHPTSLPALCSLPSLLCGSPASEEMGRTALVSNLLVRCAPQKNVVWVWLGPKSPFLGQVP